MFDPAALSFSDLPSTWLASLFQHVASGPGGLASAAVLSQTCSSLHVLSESSAVTYCNIHVDHTISSPDHPFWQWLAKRQGRVAGLTLHVENSTAAHTHWEIPIRQLAAVPEMQLTVAVPQDLGQGSHPFMTQWLGQHSHIIGHFTATVYLSTHYWSLQRFIAAAAPCQSLSVRLLYDEDVPLKFSCIADVAHSLVSLHLEFDELTGITALTCLTRLSALALEGYSEIEEPWVSLASLTGLSTLSLRVSTQGDPSPLSALTGLRSMLLAEGRFSDLHEEPLFAFSSLQPLSTMLQLECHDLGSHCCAATSLEGLSGLSSLRKLSIRGSNELCSLEGLSASLTSLEVAYVGGLNSLEGMEHAVQLQHLSIDRCSITSLQSLAALRSLASLVVSEDGVHGGHFVSLEGVEGLSSCLQRLSLASCSNLSSLLGLEKLSVLQALSVTACGITSLQPLADMNVGLTSLCVQECRNVQEDVLVLPGIQCTARGQINRSNVKMVFMRDGGMGGWG